MAEEEEPVKLGLYGENLDRYFALFPRKCFFILIFERAIANPVATLDSVASFLGIDASNFDRGKSCKSANVSFIPRFPRSYNLAFRVKQTLRRHDLDDLSNLAKRLGVERLFGRMTNQQPPLELPTRAALQQRFAADIRRLEDLIGDNLPEWRN